MFRQMARLWRGVRVAGIEGDKVKRTSDRDRRYWILYMLVAAALLAMGLFVSHTFTEDLKTQLNHEIVSELRVRAESFDKRCNHINSILTTGYQKLRTQKAVALSGVSSDSDYYAVCQARNALSEAVAAMSPDEASVRDFMFYLTAPKAAITTNTVYTLDNLAGLYFHTDATSLQAWLGKIADANPAQGLRTLPFEGFDAPAYVRVFTMVGSRNQIIAMAILDWAMLECADIRGGRVTIVDASGTSLADGTALPVSGEAMEVGKDALLHRGADSALFTVRLGSLASYRMAVSVPGSVYNQSVANAYVVVMGLTLLLCGILLYIMMYIRRSRSNLRRINQLLERKDEDHGEISFQQIYLSLSHLVRQNDELRQNHELIARQVNKRRVQMRESFVRMLMLGAEGGENLEELTDFYIINRGYDYYNVALLQIEGPGEYDAARKTRNALRVAVSGVSFCDIEACNVDDNTVGIIYMCRRSERASVNAQLKDWLKRIVDHMRQSLDVTVYTGIGSAVGRIGDCISAYYSARMVLVCNSRANTRRLNAIDSISAEDKAQMTRLLQGLERGDAGEALSLFDGLFALPGDGSYTLRQRTNAIAFLNLFDDMVNGSVSLKKLFAEDDSLQNELAKCVSLEEILPLTRRMLEQACQHSTSGEKRDMRLLIDRCLQMIQNRYTDCCLSQSQIAEELGVSPAALSVKFKEVVGVNMSMYIRMMRIDRAKELLRDGRTPLESISEQTGFGSLKTMYRVFKAETGCAPGQYREENAGRA